MAKIINLHDRKRGRPGNPTLTKQSSGYSTVPCAYCGERHPIVRLPGKERRCVTAFFDGQNWFCRNRGCRQAWLDKQ